MANYNIKHTGLNTAILTSENELDNSNLFTGVDNRFLEQVARWDFNTPNEVEFRPIKPITDIAESVKWCESLYEAISKSLVRANNDDTFEDCSSVWGNVTGIRQYFVFKKEFIGYVLPSKKIEIDCRLRYSEVVQRSFIKVISTMTLYHNLWPNDKTEFSQREQDCYVDYLCETENKLAYLLRNTHLTVNDATDFDLRLMEYFLNRMLESHKIIG